MATPPTAVTVGSRSVHQVAPGEKLLHNNQQLHNVMIQQQHPQVVRPPPYQQLGSTSTVQYVQQVPQYPNVVAPQTIPTANSKQQVMILPAQLRQPAQQDSSQSRQPFQSQATPGPPSYLYVALYITFMLLITFNVLSLLFGLPAIFFAIMSKCAKALGHFGVAKVLGKISFVLSFVNIILSVSSTVIISILLGIFL